MAGHGGGAWKVAYADFVTAMMAFFLVMWIVAQNKPVKEAVAKYFRDPFGTAGAPSGPPLAVAAPESGGLSNLKAPPKGPRGYGRGAAKVDAKAALGSALKGGAPLQGTADPGSTRVGAAVLFAEESAQLDEQAQLCLRAMAPALLGKPNKIEIRGHATGRPLPPNSPYADAWQLSYARCLAVFKFLEQEGVESHRMRFSQAGPYEPQEQPGDANWAAQNSRVEVSMLGEFADAVKTKRGMPLDRRHPSLGVSSQAGVERE
ncbi:MAG TPA: flagellar motor protein MotB [Pirellulales bacterium]|nr:flagellar motor protein MotB [Pirellulales bacterium]